MESHERSEIYHLFLIDIQTVYLENLSSSIDLFMYLVDDLLHNLQFFITYDNSLSSSISIKRLKLLERIYS